MPSEPEFTPESKNSNGSPRVSVAIHQGADGIVALFENEKQHHKMQLKDLESRHDQLKTNSALIYASASIRIKRLEAELEDVKKERSKAIMDIVETRAETESVRAELTQVEGFLDRLNASLRENRMSFFDGTIKFDDEMVQRVNELIGSSQAEEVDQPESNDTADASIRVGKHASPLFIVTAFMQYMEVHKHAFVGWEDKHGALENDYGLEKHQADVAMDTQAVTPDSIHPVASNLQYSSSTGTKIESILGIDPLIFQ